MVVAPVDQEVEQVQVVHLHQDQLQVQVKVGQVDQELDVT